MRTYPAAETLKSGSIFDLVPTKPKESRISYLVTGFKDACMQVAELGGQNRDDRVVLARDIPRPHKVVKWKFGKDMHGLRDDYVRDTLKILRASLNDLRTAEELGGSTLWYNGDPEDTNHPHLTTYVRLRGGLFNHVEYPLAPKGVRPILNGFDLGHLGALPPEHIRRDDDGVNRGFSAEVRDMRLDQAGVEAIRATAERTKVLMFPDHYLGARFLQESSREPRSVSQIVGYVPSKEKNDAQVFPDLKSAHEAVLAIHKAFSATGTK